MRPQQKKEDPNRLLSTEPGQVQASRSTATKNHPSESTAAIANSRLRQSVDISAFLGKEAAIEPLLFPDLRVWECGRSFGRSLQIGQESGRTCAGRGESRSLLPQGHSCCLDLGLYLYDGSLAPPSRRRQDRPRAAGCVLAGAAWAAQVVTLPESGLRRSRAVEAGLPGSAFPRPLSC